MKQRGAGFQKPLADPDKARQVRVAVMRTEGDTIACSCEGFAKTHARQKVREDAAQRHIERRHGGRGMWL